MLAAHNMGLTKGDWLFLDVEIFQVIIIVKHLHLPNYLAAVILFNVNVALKSSYWGDHDWHANDTDDAAARKAYEALLRYLVKASDV